MDVVKKDLENRKAEIEKELELLFSVNLKIVDWDVPESDEDEARLLLWNILNDKLQTLKPEITK